MDRAEATGLGVAAIGHAALLAALTYGFAATRLPVPKTDPIEVSFVEEVGLESTAPMPSAEAPAPLQGPEDGPPAAAMPPPPAVEPVPTPRLAAQPPAPAPKPAPAAAKPIPNPGPQKPAPAAKPAVSRPTGRLSGLLNGVADRNSDSRSTATPAAAAGPQVEASLAAEIRRQVKPHWQRAAPSGADVQSLRTELALTLGRDGSLVSIDSVRTTGQSASNRPQVALHQERAKRAVTLAAPFRLPAEYYDVWKQITVTVDLRLSQ
jgi:outer membrane biosynthesis protein TonB